MPPRHHRDRRAVETAGQAQIGAPAGIGGGDGGDIGIERPPDPRAGLGQARPDSPPRPRRDDRRLGDETAVPVERDDAPARQRHDVVEGVARAHKMRRPGG